jgi:hypothetical protein
MFVVLSDSDLFAFEPEVFLSPIGRPACGRRRGPRLLMRAGGIRLSGRQLFAESVDLRAARVLPGHVVTICDPAGRHVQGLVIGQVLGPHRLGVRRTWTADELGRRGDSAGRDDQEYRAVVWTYDELLERACARVNRWIVGAPLLRGEAPVPPPAAMVIRTLARRAALLGVLQRLLRPTRPEAAMFPERLGRYRFYRAARRRAEAVLAMVLICPPFGWVDRQW